MPETARSGEEMPLLPVSGIPGLVRGRRGPPLVASALAAAPACRALGAGVKDIRRGLRRRRVTGTPDRDRAG